MAMCCASDRIQSILQPDPAGMSQSRCTRHKHVLATGLRGALQFTQHTRLQVKSTMAMQALAPNVKELQAKYADDQQRLQLETSRLYKQANVNPLAGCLPTLATIPVFIGLYRALQLAASDGLLSEGFFFVPSLGGPTTTAQQAANQGMSWLIPFQDGAPPLGWATTGQYLILPVLLVISQYASLQISQPKGPQDPAQATTQRILKFIPLMIGASP